MNSSEIIDKINHIKARIEKLIEGGHLDEAKAALSGIESFIPGDPDLFSMKAVIAIMEGDLPTAEKCLNEALNDNGDNFDLLYNMAYICEQMKDYQIAANFYSNARRVSNAAQRIITDEAINHLRSSCGIENFKCEKVLHGTMEIANQMYTLTRGLRRHGIMADTCNYYPTYLGYKSDYVYNISAYNDKQKLKQDQLKILQNAINKYDLFHFHFGSSLTLDKSDLMVLADHSKKMFMHYWGSDVRLYSKAAKLSKFVAVKTIDEDAIKRNIELCAKYIDHCIVGDYELYEYVKDYYNNVHVLPVAIDLEKFPVKEAQENERPVVVHAPTSQAIKGTEHILKAVQELKQKYDFEFILVSNKSNECAKAIYRQADIIIDQLLIGCYGVFAVESMAMGKPVISWISDFMKEKYPKDLPIFIANPENICQQLESLLKDKQLRKDIGQKGRKYVEKYHDMNLVSRKLLDLYRNS
jgi:glycosyltransferase involved in cell wall biosynthesis